MNDMMNYNENTFENIKHIDKNGVEFWYARELYPILEYTQWRNFEPVIEKAKEACENSGNQITHHFADVRKMVAIGVSKREINDIKLSRYACYLIVMNGDSRKEVIAMGQTYFAMQTRKQEIADNLSTLTEEQKRLAIREELTQHNKSLADTAQKAGVESVDFGTFQNHGYKGLYGGMTAKEIHDHKGLKKSHKILDYMGSTELAANLFRATQTEEKLRRENIKGKDNANQTHYDVGAKVRETIKDLGGVMPEDLPTPDKGIKQIKNKLNKLDKPQNKEDSHD